jgi:hypothetical protein
MIYWRKLYKVKPFNEPARQAKAKYQVVSYLLTGIWCDRWFSRMTLGQIWDNTL